MDQARDFLWSVFAECNILQTVVLYWSELVISYLIPFIIKSQIINLCTLFPQNLPHFHNLISNLRLISCFNLHSRHFQQRDHKTSLCLIKIQLSTFEYPKIHHLENITFEYLQFLKIVRKVHHLLAKFFAIVFNCLWQCLIYSL